jgi:release factor glutamine methyltransferase
MTLTLLSGWTRTRRALEAAGVTTPVLDSRALVEEAAGVARIEIVTDPYRELSGEEIERLEALTARRVKREPLAYVLGRKEFWTLTLRVTADVLTPRPETETIVEAALQVLPADRPAEIVDLGVGSGAILLSLLTERPWARGLGVDVSAAALDVARDNAAQLGLAGRASFRLGDWAAGLEGPFDLIVSNPPYVRSGDIAGLEPEVSTFEPRLALDGGGDGLDAYRVLAPEIMRLLAPGGAFVLEIGEGQQSAVEALLRRAGLDVLDARPDLAGIARAVFGRRPVDPIA